MGKYQRLGKNAFLMLLGNIGSKLLVFLMLPFYTRWLSVSDYGTMDLIQVFVALLAGTSTLCLTESIFVFPKDKPLEKQKMYFSSGLVIFVFCLAIIALIFFIIFYFSIEKGFDYIFTEYIKSIYFLVCVSSIQAYSQQFARSIDRVDVYVISGLILTISIVLISIVLLPKYGVSGYILSLVIAGTITTLYTVVAAKEYKYWSLKYYSKDSLHEMLKYSIPLVPNTLIWWVLGTMNRPWIEYYCGIESVGVFAVANKFPMIMVTISNVFTYSWQISVIEEFKKEDYNKFYNRMFSVLFYLLSVLIIVLTCFGKSLIVLMTTESFLDAWKYIPFLSVSVVLFCLSSFVASNFVATKESKYFLSTSLTGAGVCIFLNIVFIPILGLWGAVISVLFSNLTILIHRLYVTQKHVPLENLSRMLFFSLIVFAYLILSVVFDNLKFNILGMLVLIIGIVYHERTAFVSLYRFIKMRVP